MAYHKANQKDGADGIGYRIRSQRCDAIAEIRMSKVGYDL
jgi:hypothetical protein